MVLVQLYIHVENIKSESYVKQKNKFKRTADTNVKGTQNIFKH